MSIEIQAGLAKKSLGGSFRKVEGPSLDGRYVSIAKLDMDLFGHSMRPQGHSMIHGLQDTSSVVHLRGKGARRGMGKHDDVLRRRTASAGKT